METKTIDERNPLRLLGKHDLFVKLITDDTLKLDEISF